MKRVVSLWLPSFATDRLIRLIRRRTQGQKPEAAASLTSGRIASGHIASAPVASADAPLVTVTADHGGTRVAAVSETAARAGILPGLSLAEARDLLPGLTVAEADPAGDAMTLDRLADWCGRYTPWTARDKSSHYSGDLGGGAGLWLNVSGCAHLFGGERDLLGELLTRLFGFGFTAVAAVADTPGAAWAVARFAAGNDNRPARVVPSGGTATALAPLPVAGLRLPPAVVQDLNHIGLRSIAALQSMPRESLVARFGGGVLRRLDQALGRADEPLSPRRPLPAMIARLAFTEPIGHTDDIGRAATHLIGDICARLEGAHQGARRLVLTFYLTSGGVSRAAIGTSRPTRNPVHLQRLFREKLDHLTVGFTAGFEAEVAILAATRVDPLAAVQMPLSVPQSKSSRSGQEGLAHLIDRLGNRLGANNVNRLVGRASHVPERACRENSAATIRGENKGSGARGKDRETMAAGDQQPRQPRPLVLLPWPEPIIVVAPVPDGPPVMFRRGRHRHRVRTAEGPERIGPEWWLEEGGLDPLCQSRIRDYYRIEDSDGGRFWIYREGLYRPDIPARWYLHGLFP